MSALFLTLPVLLAGWLKDETVSGYTMTDTAYVLAEIDGGPPPARATLSFPSEGRIAGEAPCNRYSADQTAPYPWFRAERIVATRRACPDLEFETEFLLALEAMTMAEALGPVLILSNDDGREMVFRAVQD